MANTRWRQGAHQVRYDSVVAVLIALALLLTAPTAQAVTETDDTLGVVKEGVAPDNTEISVRLSEATPLEDTSTVVLARDDRFADALASGVLQQDFPMLLVPSTGPIPARVIAELERLAPQRVLILGGVDAVAPDVEAQLVDRGYAVDRRAGDTRFTTATDIAISEVPTATTAILARAFPAPGSSDETQAFADTLAVGAWAAEEGWPVVLTDTEFLTAPTRQYLLASDVETVQLVGGTAAISAGVESELVALGFDVVRVAGTDRFGTAVEIAKERGADSAGDVSQITLVDSQFANSWAGGLAAAAHSAHFDAPIVLTTGSIIPPATAEFLSGGTDGGSATPLTCVAFPAACEQARVAIGLPPAAVVTSDIPDGAVVVPGQVLTVAIDSQSRAVSDVTASGTCLPVLQSADGDAVTVALGDPLPTPGCDVRIEFTVDGAAGFAQSTTLRQAEVLTFSTVVPAEGGGIAVVPSGESLDARQLASNLVGDDVQVIGASLSAAPEGAGLFAGGGSVLGFDQGIVLSTGRIADVAGPNEADSTSSSMGTPGDPELDVLSGQPTADAVVLSFDFVADADSVAFEYVFGSEEYDEFVGQGFNDVFAFTINGANCATIGGAPVSVDTVNSGANADRYRPNPPSFDPPTPLDVQLDGLTTTLTCTAPITRGATNTLRLAIADSGDDSYDSAVFIRAASFQVQ